MIDDLESPKEIEIFFKDFFDQDELAKYVKRLAVAYWLKKGRDKENIQKNLQATPKEISKAQKSLKKEGVSLALKKIEAEEWASVWAKRIKKFSNVSRYQKRRAGSRKNVLDRGNGRRGDIRQRHGKIKTRSGATGRSSCA